MATATWNGITIAESDDTVVVEGTRYFPRSSLREDVVRPSDRQSLCLWKGRASYLTLEHGDAVSVDAAWYFPEPTRIADAVRDRVAFCSDVTVAA